MSTEALETSAGLVSNLTFVARKVRMASEYYVEAKASGRVKYRICSFKLRALAKEWIEVHSADWRAANGSLRLSELQNESNHSNAAGATFVRP